MSLLSRIWRLDWMGHKCLVRNRRPLSTRLWAARHRRRHARQCKTVGKVVAVGHSLGGRLCLLSGADYKIGISPALAKTYSEDMRKRITAMRGHRVREIYPGINFDTLESLPVWDARDRERALLICCNRDVPEVDAACTEMEAKGAHVECVEDASHPDVFLNEKTFAFIKRQLEAWFG